MIFVQNAFGTCSNLVLTSLSPDAISSIRHSIITALMASESLSWDHQVDDRIKEISQRLDGHDTFNNKDAPGLKNLLDKYLAADELEPQVFVRDFLKVFKDSETDGAYSQILKQHTPAEQKQVEAFVHGRPLEEVPDDFAMGPSLGVRQELKRLDQADEIAHVSFDSITPLKITRPIEEHEVHGVAAHLEKAEHALSREFHKAVDFLSQSFTHSHVASTQSHADAKLETTHSLLVSMHSMLSNDRLYQLGIQECGFPKLGP